MKVWGNIISYIIKPSFYSQITTLYVIMMVLTYTFILIWNVIRLREKCQRYYFYHFANRQRKKKEEKIDFLDLRTILITGVEDYNLNGDRLKRELEGVLEDSGCCGKVLSVSYLKEHRRLFKYYRQLNSLDFYREIADKHKVNCLTLKLMGKNHINDKCYNSRRTQITEKVKNLIERPVNSGYAFVCFDSIEAISVVKHWIKR